MSGPSLGFAHRFVPASLAGLPALLLLHGTGGNEDDLLPLAERLLPGAAQLSPRGRVLERGMPRFFRRLAEGVFDLDDLRLRTHELADFVDAARRTYDLGAVAPIAVGLSNGANIAAAMLLLRPGTLGGALLLRPMVPLEPDPRRARRSATCSGARARPSRSIGSAPVTTWRPWTLRSARAFSRRSPGHRRGGSLRVRANRARPTAAARPTP